MLTTDVHAQQGQKGSGFWGRPHPQFLVCAVVQWAGQRGSVGHIFFHSYSNMFCGAPLSNQGKDYNPISSYHLKVLSKKKKIHGTVESPNRRALYDKPSCLTLGDLMACQLVTLVHGWNYGHRYHQLELEPADKPAELQ